MSEAGTVPPGWYTDPMGRFDHRYWNGTAWTDSVSRGGIQHEDPVQSPPEPEVAFEAGQAAAPTDEPVDISAAEATPKRKGLTNRAIVIAAVAFVVVIAALAAVAALNKDADPKPALSASASVARSNDLLGHSVPQLRTALTNYTACSSVCVPELRAAYKAAQSVELDVTVLSDPARYTFPEGYLTDLDDLQGAATAFDAKAASYLQCVDGPAPGHCGDVPAPSVGDMSDPAGADYLGSTLHPFER